MTGRPCTGANGRLRISMPSSADQIVEFHLDGWPLVLVGLDAGCIRVNDLRATHTYAHVGHLPRPIAEPAVDTGPGGTDHSILIAVGTLIASIHLDPDRPTHAEVRAVQMDARLSRADGMLLDCEVRYRQLPQQPAARLRPVDADPK